MMLSYNVQPLGTSSLFFCHMMQHAEIPQPGIESAPCAVEVWSLNHWTTKKFQDKLFSLSVTHPGCRVSIHSLDC